MSASSMQSGETSGVHVLRRNAVQRREFRRRKSGQTEEQASARTSGGRLPPSLYALLSIA